MPTLPRQYRMLDMQDYKAYFEALAEQANFIDQFYYTTEVMLEKQNVSRKGTVMVLEPYTNQINGHDADNIQSFRKGQFIIAKSVKSPTDAQNAWMECEKLAYKIVGRMYQDMKDRVLIAQVQSWTGSELGLLTNALYTGYSIEFTYYAPINRFLVPEEGDWKQE